LLLYIFSFILTRVLAENRFNLNIIKIKALKNLMRFLMIRSILILTPIVIYSQNGCCSWHGGVAGCPPNGRTIFADEKLLPICSCGYLIQNLRIN
jgi:hypothetical protein